MFHQDEDESRKKNKRESVQEKLVNELVVECKDAEKIVLMTESFKSTWSRDASDFELT